MMKLHEAIKKATDDPHAWFRPVSWKWQQQAFCIVDGVTYRVPSLRGGAPSMTHHIDELMGEWEVTTPDEVLASPRRKVEHEVREGSRTSKEG